MKWTESTVITGMTVIAAMCSAGAITRDQKEALLEDLLDEAGWTRTELQEMNRRREARNN